MLSTNFGPASFIGSSELVALHKLTETFRCDMVFTQRYLCHKYALQMITNYLDLAQLEGAHLFKMVGELPFELVSVSDSIVYTDRDGL